VMPRWLDPALRRELGHNTGADAAARAK
jgi:hypothetical protein